MRNIFKKSLFIAIGCLLATAVWADTFTLDFSTQSTTHAVFPINAALTQYTYSSNAKIDEWKLLEVASGASFVVTNTTGVTISAIKVEGVADNNSNKSTTVKISDGTNEITTGSSSWNNRKSTSMTTKNFSNVSKLKTNAGTQYTITNSGYKVGLRVTFTYTGGSTPPSTVAVTGVSLNKTTTSINVGSTETLTETVSPSNATDKSVTWSSDNTAVATVNNGVVTGVSAGTATITVTTTDGSFTAQCTVTVSGSPAPPQDPVLVSSVTLDKSSETIKVGNTVTLTATVLPLNATNQTLTWASSNTAIATVNNGVVTGVAAGGPVTIIAASTDGSNKSATCQITVEENVTPPPTTDLTTHVPDIYAAKEIAGGYGGTLRVINGREYEVYYPGKTNSDSYASVCIHPNTQKQDGITTNTSTTYTKAADGWFDGSIYGISNYNLAENEEFEEGATNVTHKMKSNNAYKLHVSGFDQFSIIAKDKKLDNTSDHSKPQNDQLFEVFIDGNVQPRQSNASSATIRRYNMSTGEHLIEVRAINDGASELYGFSLRIAEVPRVKKINGNDTTQTVMQTQSPKPVYYFTKYNVKGETRLEWDGAAATGITLTTVKSAALGDTLMLGGVANCAVGNYKYNVVTYMNNVETSRLSGKFSVAASIKAKTDTLIDVRQNSQMEEIKFDYYALSADAITLTWTGTTPAGISGSGANGKYTISGKPTTVGEFPFSVSVAGGNTLTGKITVSSADLGPNPVLYLCRKTTNASQDGVYEYLKSRGVNFDPQKALSKLRDASEYALYKWILISEDVDADNPEVLQLIRERKLPILNMKGFTYAAGRLGWGEPDNGTISAQNGGNIFLQQPSHPIFNSISYKTTISMLTEVENKGVMPIAITQPAKSICLATAYTRNIDNYDADGELQTSIHEIPAQGDQKKYICFPIAKSSQDKLTADGKTILNNIVTYLTTDVQSPVTLPELEITSFIVADKSATIDQEKNTIQIRLTVAEFEELDSLSDVKVAVQLKTPLTTHLVPSTDENFDLSLTTFLPQPFAVTDYINRRVYNFSILLYDPQGIEDVYEAGQWVNIFDIYGRKITTTNENIYTMDLPRGIYLVVTESGQTIKIMR